MSLSAGFAARKITPEIGMPIYRGAPCAAVLDDLYARAVALESGGEKALVVSCDLLEVELAWSREVCSRIEAATGVPAGNIIIACTHSHSTPAMVIQPDEDGDGPGETVLKWRALLAEQLVRAASEACEDLAPALVKAGRSVSYAGVNRRCPSRRGMLHVRSDPDGVMDPDVTALVFEAAGGEPRAAMVHYACHPVIYKCAGMNNVVAASRDFPGVAVDLLEDDLGCAVVFANGCCGDVNPMVGCDDIKEPELKQAAAYKTGEMIADAALNALESPAAVDTDAPLVCRTIRFELARVPWPGEAGCDYRFDERLTRNMDVLIGHWAPRETRDADGRPVLPTEITAVRVGDLAFIGLPGEIFTHWGLKIKGASPAAWTLALSNADDYVGYFPTVKAMREGGSGTRPPMCVLTEDAIATFESALEETIAAIG